MYCESGYVQDENGCDTCECNERDPHCAELEARYPECDEENYEGDLPCAPSEEDMTYYEEHCDEEAMMCRELEAKYPECDEENYEGDMACAPSEEDMSYYEEHCE